MSFNDLFDHARTLRIYHDGYNPPGFGLSAGTEFPKVYYISNDGVRLRILYGPTKASATFYPVYAPWALYTLKEMVTYDLPYKDVTGYSQSFTIDNIGTTRILEHDMAYHGQSEDVARIGAEVAYTVARGKLGLSDVVMNDPSEGGSDLYTPGHKVVIEARMLQRTVYEPIEGRNLDLSDQLKQMVGRLHSDFSYYKSSTPTAGYAILTYIADQNTIKTIVLKVLPP